MADNIGQRLVTIGAYLQVVFWMISIGMLIWSLLIFLPLILDPVTGMSAIIAFFVAGIYYVAMIITGVIFMLLWFEWQKRPEAHRRNLIITGVLALVLAGFIPGLLVLIGALMIKQ